MGLTRKLPLGAAFAATTLTLVTAGCGSPARPAGPPSTAFLAHKLGCRIDNWTDTPLVAAYDVSKAVDTTCPGYGLGDEIMTFSSAGKETDWLHENTIAESGTAVGNGYPAVVVGHLWIIYPSDAVAGIGRVIQAVGGREADF